MNVSPHRVRFVTVLAGLIALVAAFGAQGSRAAEPKLILSVNLSGSLEVVLGNGTRIRTTSAPGAVIPPGSVPGGRQQRRSRRQGYLPPVSRLRRRE